MKVFISHNKSDKASARLFATAVVQQGGDVWFDEWEVKPGDSIAGGISEGISNADMFVLIWSANAQRSHWVGMEVNAYIHRRVVNNSLRIIPIMLDDTPLPTLVADHKGFYMSEESSLEEITAEILGVRPDREITRLLQNRLLEMTTGMSGLIDPLPYFVCPKCGSPELSRSEQIDYQYDDRYLIIQCKECRWSDSEEL